MKNPPKSASEQFELAKAALRSREAEQGRSSEKTDGLAGEFHAARDNAQKPQVIPMQPLERKGAQPIPGLNYNPPTMNRAIAQEPLKDLDADVRARNAAFQKDSAKLNNSLDLQHGNKDRDDRSK